MEGTVFLHKTLGPSLNLWRWQSGQGSFPGRKYQTLHERWQTETIEMSNLEEIKYIDCVTIMVIQCRTTVYPVKIMKFCVDWYGKIFRFKCRKVFFMNKRLIHSREKCWWFYWWFLISSFDSVFQTISSWFLYTEHILPVSFKKLFWECQWTELIYINHKIFILIF